MISNRLLRTGHRSLHTSAANSTTNTVLYGWGQTQALPLTRGYLDRVLGQPTNLQKEEDYALPVSDLILQVIPGYDFNM
jgi:hypothetical protein